jgi:rare lipoprotein A
VTINDRGPFIRGRIIDLTPAGARALGFSGLTQVTVERMG